MIYYVKNGTNFGHYIWFRKSIPYLTVPYIIFDLYFYTTCDRQVAVLPCYASFVNNHVHIQ